MESQRQASPSFHEPLGNLAKTARFPHSLSSDDEGGWKSGKRKARFPLSHRPEPSLSQQEHKTRGGLSPSARGGAPRASTTTSTNWVTFWREAIRPGFLIVAEQEGGKMLRPEVLRPGVTGNSVTWGSLQTDRFRRYESAHSARPSPSPAHPW